MICKPAFKVSLAILVAASTGFPAQAQLTTPSSTCAAPQAPPEPLMITVPNPPAEPSCANVGCTKSVANKFNGEMQAFNDAMQKASDEYSAYRQKLLEFSKSSSDYANCEITRINKFMGSISN